MKLLKLFLLLFIPSVIYSQSFGERFISSLAGGSNADSYINPDELKISGRLGISYEGVKHKFFIAYDIDEKVKQKIREGSLKYDIKYENEGNGNRIIFTTPGYTQSFYFADTQLISPAKYYSRDWQVKESEFFKFFISDSLFFNEYSAGRLDGFVSYAVKILGYSEEEIKKLKENRIYYFLCRNDNEIERLTGYKAKGNYILSCDYIITTYNCHYHEIVHLLVNNKLKHLPLFTHPFLQEDIAVALGGRGGYEPEVMLNPGKFIQVSGYADYREYLDYNNYKNNDASFTYPLSGLYNLFLLKQYNNASEYFELYKKYSSGIEQLQNSEISPADLPAEEIWKSFAAGYSAPGIIPGFEENKKEVIFNSDSLTIYGDSENLYFKTAGNILLSPKDKLRNYRSKLFDEELPGKNYAGEKYLIKVRAEEVSLYNLYTNNLTANYAAGFSPGMKLIPREDGCFMFTVPRKLFDGEIGEISFSAVHTGI
jgi:hypothetical protein